MSQPAQIDIEIYENSQYDGRFNVYTDAAKTSAKDLTGYTAVMQIRGGLEDSDELTKEYTSDGGDITVDSSGFLDVVIPGEDSADQEDIWSGQLYDLFIVDPNGARFAIATGSIVVIPSVTRFS